MTTEGRGSIAVAPSDVMTGLVPVTHADPQRPDRLWFSNPGRDACFAR